MILTYKYRLKGKRTVRQLRRYAFAVNRIWNYCVDTQRETQRRWKSGSKGRWLSQYDLQNLTKATSSELGVHAQSIQGVCEQFAKSRNQRKRCPRFRRSSGARRSLGWIPGAQSRQLNGNSVTYLDNTYRFFGTKCRPLPVVTKGGVFVEDAQGRWWVTFQIDVVTDEKHGRGAIGIDLGLKTLATLSTCEKIDNITPFHALEKKLSIAQRAGNRCRAKAIHAKIANVRRNHLHQISARLIRENQKIFVGNVSSSKLAKTQMAKAVYDVGWSTFKNMLRYKASRHGVIFLEVDESFTTQTCSSCGALPPERPRGIAGLGIREWRCSSCGANHDRDVNAARNILILGLSAQPRGDESRDPSAKRVA